MIDFTKPIQTRDGRPVRILCTDARGKYPVVGLLPSRANNGEVDIMASWTRSGHIINDHAKNEDDLVNVPVKHKLSGYVMKLPQGEFECTRFAVGLFPRVAKFDIEFEDNGPVT